MTAKAERVKEIWVEMLDRDIDALINGDEILNDDLAPLQPLIRSLRSIAERPPPPGFIEVQVSQAAHLVREQTMPSGTSRPTTRRFSRLRRRAMATATSLIMALGSTGVALASDNAVPGDWNYGIDRALERFGIGAGGSEERTGEAVELAKRAEAAITSGPAHKDVRDVGRVGATTDIDDSTSLGRPEPVSDLLDYLSGIDRPDGMTVSELARLLNPHPPAAPQNAASKKPVEPGKPANPGKPADAPGKVTPATPPKGPPSP